MALVSQRTLFLHVPKAAGTWIRNLYIACGIEHSEYGIQHTHFPALLQHATAGFYTKKFIYAFVRHPLTWYQSRWAFRMKYGWQLSHPLDRTCASNNFQQFVMNALEQYPNGWVTKEFTTVIDVCPKPIDYVGRAEFAVSDMLQVARLSGEKFDENIITSLPRVNDSDLDGKSSRYWAKYTPKLLDAVLEAERCVIDKYYSDFEIDTKRLL